MYEGFSDKVDSYYKDISEYYDKCKINIAMHEENQEKRAKQENNLKVASNNLTILRKSQNKLKKLIKDIKVYQDEKESRSMGGIYRAFFNTLQVVPSAAGCKLDRKNGKAVIRTSKDFPIQYIEGGAYRATLSMFTRNSVLKNAEDYLDFLMLDEALSVLKEDKSAELSRYIDVMAQDFQMVMVEQKQQIFENIKKLTVYEFEQQEGVTRVKEVRHE